MSGAKGATKAGNTRRPSAGKNWCFTLNNFTDKDLLDIQSFIKSGAIEQYVIGKEVGATNSTPHLQGFFRFKKRVRPFGCDLNEKIHWEKAKGSLQQNFDYCTKESLWIHNMEAYEPLKIISQDKLFKWERDIIDIINKPPDDRKIYWFYDKKGGKGKTTFAKYLSHHYNAVPVEGKKNDVLYVAAVFQSNIYIFDFERSMEDFVPYGAMEKIKNGYFMCAKYESKPIIRNVCHVIVFANFEPDYEKLSEDRWVVTKL